MQRTDDQRRLPDPEICVTEMHQGLAHYAICRTDDPGQCAFVVPFGHTSYYCCHPKRENFMRAIPVKKVAI